MSADERLVDYDSMYNPPSKVEMVTMTKEEFDRRVAKGDVKLRCKALRAAVDTSYATVTPETLVAAAEKIYAFLKGES